MPTGGAKWNPDAAEVAQVYVRCGSLAKASRELGVSMSTLQTFMTRNRIPRNGCCLRRKITCSTDELGQMYHSGMSMQEVADKFGATRAGVSFRMKALGIKKGRRSTPPTRHRLALIKELARLYPDEPRGIAGLAERFAMPNETVATYLRLSGVHKHSRYKGLPASAALDVQCRYDAGASIKEIAAVYEVSAMTIHRYMVRHDIPRRPQGHRRKNLGVRT